MSEPTSGPTTGHRTALVTGVSSGIGLATARALSERGHRVVGTSRSPERIAAADRLAGVDYRALDLTDHAGIDTFVDVLVAEGLRPDVVVNNAGESQSGPLEDLPVDALERLFAVNVLGPVHLTGRLLPGMRAAGYGRVVMVGSMLASFPLAYRSSYVASKAAIKGFATAARFENSPYGVWTTTVEPGSISTGISERRTKYIADGSPHAERFARMLEILDGKERDGVDADAVARTILVAIDADEPEPLYAVGSNAPAVFAARRALPRPLVERMIARTFGLGPHRR